MVLVYLNSHIKLYLPQLFIISGPNGAGKTTASYTLLPEILNIREFINADEIARGLSPFQPESVSLQAGRIMLNRIDELMALKKDFAFETTLSTKSFVGLVNCAKANGYHVTLVYFWLETVELAIERVAKRVLSGGHNIPTDTIKRRYHAGIRNFINLYLEIVDEWLLFDNSKETPQTIAKGNKQQQLFIEDETKWEKIKTLGNV